MIKIGLTDTGTEWKHINYVRWIIGGDGDAVDGVETAGTVGEGVAAGMVEVIRLSAALGNLNEAVGCDGLVLSGGIDIDPSLYSGGFEYKRSPAAGWEKRS